MSGRPPTPRARAAVGLAALAAGAGGVGLARELAGGSIGVLRSVFVALGAVAAAACLLAARREEGAVAWMLAALGATLAVCTAAVLA